MFNWVDKWGTRVAVLLFAMIGVPLAVVVGALGGAVVGILQGISICYHAFKMEWEVAAYGSSEDREEETEEGLD